MTQITGIQGNSGTAMLERMRSFGESRQRIDGNLPPEPPQGMEDAFRAAAAEQGIDVETLDGLQETIRGKVQETMQNGGSFEDVQGAIDSVLRDNGIDPEKLHEQMQATAGAMGPPHGMNAGGSSGLGSLGSQSLLGLDLGKLLAGETKGLSYDRRA